MKPEERIPRLRDISREYVSRWYDTEGFSTRFEVRMQKYEERPEQKAYFSITYETRRVRCGVRTGIDSFGANADTALANLLAAGVVLDGKDTLLPGLLKWHCTDIVQPLHYATNATYWFRRFLFNNGELPVHKRKWLRTYEPHRGEMCDLARCLDNFRSTVIFGAVEGDVLPSMDVEFPDEPPKSLVYVGLEADAYETAYDKWVDTYHELVNARITEWCEARHDQLMRAFEGDMVAFWGEEILSGP